jgi:hypothetical protein
MYHEHHYDDGSADELTLSDFLAAPLDALFQLSQSVERGEYLDSTNGIQHVSIVSRSSTEAAIVVQTGEDEVEDLSARESIRVS